MLKLQNITKTYHETLFDNVNFLLGNGEKVGLVGLNGTGKTTLFKLIAGLEEPDSGFVEMIGEKIGYLPQEFSWQEGQLVGEYLESLIDDPYTEKYKVQKVLARLNMIDIDEYQDITSMSEGQKMKLYIAKLLLENATILLLDEPTNHLDLDGILWFEEFINDFEGICIIISHDRAFLNNTVKKVFEIDENKVLVFEGNYDDYIDAKRGYVEDRDKAFVAQERKRRHLEKLLATARKRGAGKKQAKAISHAKKRMEREVTRVEINKYKEKRVEGLEIKGSVHDMKKILELKGIQFSYTDRELIKEASLQIRGKEKLWFLGNNGIGKTTLIKIITGELKPESGELIWGSDINWAYFSQNQGHLDMNQTVEDYFIEGTGIPYRGSFKILERFLFPKELRMSKLSQLSPGQRARLTFAVFSQHNYDFLILDEPTNHLDIRTKEIIEEALREFKGGFILISHDRYFVESVGVDRVITLEDGVLVEKV